jgi:hypothetical protein
MAGQIPTLAMAVQEQRAAEPQPSPVQVAAARRFPAALRPAAEPRSPPDRSPLRAGGGARLVFPMEDDFYQPCCHSKRFDLGFGMT